MQLACRTCHQGYEVTADDLVFYEKVSPTFGGKKELIPPPTLCPPCRQRKRLAFRNERKLYNDRCDKCEQEIISVYSPEATNPTYCPNCFWSDSWDPLSYGKPFDFSRTFTEQFREVARMVPALNIISLKSVNCEYDNYAVESKDCYLCFRVGGSEKVLYSYLSINSLSCMDCFNIFDCKYCYECIDCEGCYQTYFSARCKNVNNSSYCYDCVGCADCFGCSGLRNQRYCFLNVQLTPEDYAKRVVEVSTDRGTRESFLRKFRETAYLQTPHKATFILNGENADGDCITNSKNVRDGFDIEQSEDVRHSWGVEHSRDVSDGSYIYYGEKCHEAISNSHSTDMLFSFGAYDSHDLLYCMTCYNGSHDLFGCTNVKKGQYCILNTQYAREAYEALVPRIIEHMRKTGEWGAFLDQRLSPFGYNETVAQEYFPSSQEQVSQEGFKWNGYISPTPTVEKTVSAAKVPDRIEDIPDAILDWAVECEVSGKPFRITKQELAFLREHHLPLPKRHPDIRHVDRVNHRNPRMLFTRTCGSCGKTIQSSYAPERPEKVVCEECYLKEVY